MLRKAAFLAILADLVAGGLLTASVSAGSTEQAPKAGSGVSVIVRAEPGREQEAEAAAERLGGRIGMRLSVINGFVATIPASAQPALYANPAVLSVSEDRRLAPQSSSYSVDYNPNSDGYSMQNITKLTGARAWWAAGYTGQGVGVALIDSGVAPVQGLDDNGKVVNGPDLSLESQVANLRDLDTFGHGTFMAGLIAGRDAAPSPNAPASTYLGMAPDAQIVSLKVGDADGGTDVSQVIAAIDWVVQHRNDNGLNIRVINLSYGTNSTQGYQSDPLAYAAEQAWKSGLVVVAAAGNTGYQRGAGAPGLADPSYDPYVIAVAGADTMGSTNPKKSVMASYSASSAGCGSCKNPDITSPSAHLQGLRVPNSFIDVNHPEGFLSDRYFRGSGTSEATAITSGAIALLLQKYPSMSPDVVKKFLTSNAFKIAGADTQAQGAGEFQLASMLTKSPPPSAAQNAKPSNGLGSIEASRGQDHLTWNGVSLSGEEDIFGQTIDTHALAAAEAAGNSWSGGTWNGNTWSGNSWSGNSWSGSTWSGNSWSGSSWSGSSWSGNTWSGNSWSGSTWSGNSWSGSSWSGGSWAGAYWG
jgi:serine protease AprX